MDCSKGPASLPLPFDAKAAAAAAVADVRPNLSPARFPVSSACDDVTAMAKAQREWAEALAAQQPLAQEEVAAFVSSVARSNGAVDGGAAGLLAAAAASLEAVVPLALFLSRSLGKVSQAGWNSPWFRIATIFLQFCVASDQPASATCPTCPPLQFPDAVVPQIVAALQTVVRSAEALAADANLAAAVTATAGTLSAPGALAPIKWASLLDHAMAELGAVLALLPLHADWKAQLSGAMRALLQQLLALAARRPDQQGAMLVGFRSALVAGRQRLPLTSGDAAQVGSLLSARSTEPADSTACAPVQPALLLHARGLPGLLPGTAGR